MYKKRIFSQKNANMISLIKSGIVCLVSMFLSEVGFISKTRLIETTYSNQLVQTSQHKESSML